MDKKIYEVEITKIDNIHLYITVDKQAYRIEWANCSPLLAKATQIEREYLEVSPSGYGIHWPLIDEDLAIKPLLERTEKLENEIAVPA